jgi:hypothetical protein
MSTAREKMPALAACPFQSPSTPKELLRAAEPKEGGENAGHWLWNWTMVHRDGYVTCLLISMETPLIVSRKEVPRFMAGTRFNSLSTASLTGQ